jgi:hypothetical protein
MACVLVQVEAGIQVSRIERLCRLESDSASIGLKDGRQDASTGGLIIILRYGTYPALSLITISAWFVDTDQWNPSSTIDAR